ncbi:TIGR01459 family HAD-type hydrolase [Aliiroseovarius lamellibrachiae]|uniref:TIGR01459 family HAD-type hydrolase n=1 Tax=Aliiroseovarius lamellibrachiae TaxID=1924933 RepID=UPI001BE06177|nr:TIGR01459 family HAD-type hydrolase [Aliiroseovarius lamellibrachiae]MBT2130524.1 TIGR01459 family HAD-type hydrolase [Aliiroseovarius lamellibrachiae]
MTRIITALSEISANYDALFVDLWGCVHNGITAFDEAVAALRTYRANGGFVVLVTNSPKPRAGVMAQLPEFGVPSDCYDTIATSGDSARAAMYTGAVGNKVYFMGEWDRDAGFFEPMDVIDNPVEITRVPVSEAEGIVCCGPFDPMADPKTWRADLMMAKQLGQKLLCANPDIVVDRGEDREWCAGAVAKMYTEMGGESLYFGKPHPPIYDLARRRMLAEGRDVRDTRILAIGDGIHTDIRGAQGEDIDSLFITGGLAREDTGTTDQPDQTALSAFVEKEMITPTFAIGYLR